jgi:hypothetical protein
LFPPILSRPFFPAYYFALVVSRQLHSCSLFLAKIFSLVLSRKLVFRSISPANLFPAYSFPLVLSRSFFQLVLSRFSCQLLSRLFFPASSFPPSAFRVFFPAIFILQVLYKTT